MCDGAPAGRIQEVYIMEFEDEYVEEFEVMEEDSQKEEDQVATLFQRFDKDKWEAYKAKRLEPCVPYSVPSLTKHCKGHIKGTVTLVMAPSNCGKTMFCIQEIAEDLKAGYDVIYCSEENSQMMLYSAMEAAGYTEDYFNRVHYISWYEFFMCPNKKEYMQEHNITSIYFDYIGGDIFSTGEAYSISAEMKGFMAQLHKQCEEADIYGCVFVQQNPCDEEVDFYDGSYIQSCRSLHQPVDVFIALRYPNKKDKEINVEEINKGFTDQRLINRKIQVIKNRQGTTRKLFNIPMYFNKDKHFDELDGGAYYYDGREVEND